MRCSSYCFLFSGFSSRQLEGNLHLGESSRVEHCYSILLRKKMETMKENPRTFNGIWRFSGESHWKFDWLENDNEQLHSFVNRIECKCIDIESLYAQRSHCRLTDKKRSSRLFICSICNDMFKYLIGKRFLVPFRWMDPTKRREHRDIFTFWRQRLVTINNQGPFNLTIDHSNLLNQSSNWFRLVK